MIRAAPAAHVLRREQRFAKAFEILSALVANAVDKERRGAAHAAGVAEHPLTSALSVEARPVYAWTAGVDR